MAKTHYDYIRAALDGLRGAPTLGIFNEAWEGLRAMIKGTNAKDKADRATG